MTNRLKKISSYLNLDSVVFNFVINLLPDLAFFNSHVRPIVARMFGLKCGSGCEIKKNIYFEGHRNMVVGNNVCLNRNSYFDADGGIIIGDNVKFGPQTMLITGTHEVGQSWQRMGKLLFGKICIEPGCWIGAQVTITAGATLGRGSVVSAGSVIQRSMPPNYLIAGNPARAVLSLNEPGQSSTDENSST